MAEADKTKAAELSPESGPGPQNAPAPESGNSEKERRAGDDAARNETEPVDGEPAGAKTDEQTDEQTDEPGPVNRPVRMMTRMILPHCHLRH